MIGVSLSTDGERETIVSVPEQVRVDGPLAPYAPGFSDELSRWGYTPGSAAHQLRLMKHLSRWMAEHALPAKGLMSQVNRYLAARRAAGYLTYLTPAALAALLGHLRRLNAVAELPVVAGNAVEELLDRYRRYLLTERGLADSTVRLRIKAVRPFLARRMVHNSLDLQTLTAADVSSFILAVSSEGRRQKAQTTATAMRSLLRYLHVEGMICHLLTGAVPSVASWQLAALPRGLEPPQVSALVASCDHSTVAGRRDLAMVLLLARLGLRAGEVADLTLDDVDWHAGEIIVRGKGGRHERVPLPDDVGRALVGYLRHGRPATTHGREVFVRALAPHRRLTSGAVSMAVRTAARRAGLGSVGAHRLRHFAATRLLSAGAPLAEIGQLLRHSKASTTAIYAKVDRQALRRLARPWPAGVA